jgi:hypothetical protein
VIEPAFILWDIALPKLDGLTGQGGLLARVKAKMVGATDYLNKPLRENEYDCCWKNTFRGMGEWGN